MADNIFLIGVNGELTEMTATAYDSEALLQDLISDHPDLLGGAQINPDSPRRWLLVRPEMPVPDAAGGVDRWSIDHLFVDQEAIPTLVEVKRATDTRIRREVVGQMLDYAANATVYWSVERARGEFEAGCEARSVDPDDELEKLIGPEASADEFWSRVETNLKAGRLRLLFLADQIPKELRRVVEFLNQQMNPAEVLAVEVPQFVGGGQRALVPRVIGLTERTQAAKSGPRARRQWDEPSFLKELAGRETEGVANCARAVFDHCRDIGLVLEFGNQPQEGSVKVIAGATGVVPASLETSGYLTLYPRRVLDRPEFEPAAAKEEFVRRFSVVGKPIEPGKQWTSFRLRLLQEPEALRAFYEALDWTVDRLNTPDA